MKNALLLFFVVVLVSCDKKEPKKYENEIQQNFIDFVKSWQLVTYKNELEQDELKKDYESKLLQKIDSVYFFENWKGKISDISKKEFDETVYLEFKLKPDYYKDNFDNIEFQCSYIISKSNIANDSIYQIVKTFENNELVYFDGFISKNYDGTINYLKKSNYGLREEIVNNWFNFNILEISKTSLPTKSGEFKKGIRLFFDNMIVLEKFRAGEISEKQLSKQVFNSKKTWDKLPKNEIDYLSRLNIQLQRDYLRE